MKIKPTRYSGGIAVELGPNGLKHVSGNVVRHAPCPVLVVREEEREFMV
jgi:hypothetical protein